MTKFDNLFNSIINENEDRYMPGSKNTHSTKEEINSQINSYVQELQQSENFDQTVQDVIETAVMLIRGKRTEHCLEMFNIFKKADLQTALSEMFRVLKPQGRLVMSDPICDEPLPEALRDNDQMRAACLSGAISLEDYIAALVNAGFATIEIRARHAYRVLSPEHHKTDKLIAIDSVEVCAIKDPMPPDGPCVFSGKTAIYYGDQPYFDDRKGHLLMVNQPLAVCDKTAAALQSLNESIYISPSTYHYKGGGCC